MSVLFTSTLTADLPLAAALPCTVAFWMKPDAAVFKPVVIAGTDVAGTNDLYLALGGTAAQHFVIGADGPGPTSGTFGIGTMVPGAWTYVMGRFSGIANRWIHIINPDGTITSGQDTTSVAAPTGMTQSQFGGNFGAANFAGTIAEFWVSTIDVYPGGGAIDAAFLRQLAGRGPFVIPSIANTIAYYLPFGPSSGEGPPDPVESYTQSGRNPKWTNLGATVGGDIPPIWPNYSRPKDIRRIAVI